MNQAPCCAGPSQFLFWTKSEEKAFAEIQAVSRLSRIQAIHLWKRCRRNTDKALNIARDNYPPLTDRQLASIERLRHARNGVTLRAHLPAGALKSGGFAQTPNR